MFKKPLALVMGLMMLVSTALQAGNANLAWEYNFVLEPGIASFRLYSVPGSNTVFTAGNANADFTNTVTRAAASINAATNQFGVTTNLTATVSNLTSGWWTFVATAVHTNGIESLNSNTTNGPVRPGAPFSLLVQ